MVAKKNPNSKYTAWYRIMQNYEGKKNTDWCGKNAGSIIFPEKTVKVYKVPFGQFVQATPSKDDPKKNKDWQIEKKNDKGKQNLWRVAGVKVMTSM